MTTEALDRAVEKLDDGLLRDMILRTIQDKVGSAMQAGRTPQEAGREAYEALRGRGWLPAWTRLFGPQAMVDQWRTTSSSRLARFIDVVEDIPESSARYEAPSPQAVHAVQPRNAMPVDPEPSFAITLTERTMTVGKVPSVNVLSSDPERLSRSVEALLSSDIRVAGIWTTVGDLRKSDLLTKCEENRQRTLSIVQGARRRREAYMKLGSYFESDSETIRALVLRGRINQDMLREAFEHVDED